MAEELERMVLQRGYLLLKDPK